MAMRIAVLFLTLSAVAVVFTSNGMHRSKVLMGSMSAAAQPISSVRIDFPAQIKPILEARCQPCHFSGGKVYDKMPFDRPETIKTLGTKLFTRIKDEREQQLIREFLAQN